MLEAIEVDEKDEGQPLTCVESGELNEYTGRLHYTIIKGEEIMVGRGSYKVLNK